MSHAKVFKIKVKKGGYPVVLPVDGYAIDAIVTRFTIEQRTAFLAGFERIQDPHSARLVSMRMPGEEQEKRQVPRAYSQEERARIALVDELNARRSALETAGVAVELLDTAIEALAVSPHREEFVVPDEEIRRRRLVEMTPGQLAEYHALTTQEEAAAARFIEEALSNYLVIAPGQITEEDGADEREITSGADFARIYGGRQDVQLAALGAIYEENTLSDALKNALSLRRGSRPSSDARELEATEAPGARPGDRAAHVEPERSATSGTATASSEATSSGLTAAANG